MVQLGYSEIRDTFLAICGADRVSGRRTHCYSRIGHQFSFYATDRNDVGDAVVDAIIEHRVNESVKDATKARARHTTLRQRALKNNVLLNKK